MLCSYFELPPKIATYWSRDCVQALTSMISFIFMNKNKGNCVHKARQDIYRNLTS